LSIRCIGKLADYSIKKRNTHGTARKQKELARGYYIGALVIMANQYADIKFEIKGQIGIIKVSH